MKKTVIIVVILALIGLAAYYYWRYQEIQKLVNNPTELAKSEVEDIINRVGKLMVLPKGEEPTLATVSDKSKLAKQSFFSKAENGDKILFYIKAKKAIIYRPSSNKIIEVAPITVGNDQEATSSSKPVPTAPQE